MPAESPQNTVTRFSSHIRWAVCVLDGNIMLCEEDFS